MNIESTTITINLSDSQDVTSLESGNFIQRRALSDIANLLKKHLLKLKKSKASLINDQNHLFLYPRSHDTISIQGGRGSGKTTFIRNLLCWLDGAENPPETLRELVPEFIPLGVLDPTLIENKENIFVLILNAIKQRVDKQLQCSNPSLDTYESGEYESWLRSLKDLARGLSLLDGIGGKEGMGDEWEDPNYILEKGLTDARSSTKLEKNFHDFIDNSINLIAGRNSTSSFVLAIDDIDTDFSRGWPVLEVLRRYLTSDRLVIILSGDMELYALLLRNQLWDNFNSNFLVNDPVAKHNSTKSNDRSHRANSTADMVNHIQSQYLLKILKPTNRIELRSLHDTLQDSSVDNIRIISQDSNYENNIQSILEKFTTNYLYLRRKNDKSLINELILRQPTRTVIQFLSLVVSENSNEHSKSSLNQLHLLSSSFIDILSSLNIGLDGLRSVTDDRIIFTIVKFLQANDIWIKHSDLHPNDYRDDLNLALLILNSYATTIMNRSPSLFFKYSMKILIPELSVTRKITTKDINDIASFLQLDKLESVSRTAGRITSVLAPVLIESKENKKSNSTNRSTCIHNGVIRVKRDVRDAKSIYSFYPISTSKGESQSAENAERDLLKGKIGDRFIDGWKPYYDKLRSVLPDTSPSSKPQLKGVWYNLIDHFKVDFWSDVSKIPINDNIVTHGTRTRCFNIINILAFISDALTFPDRTEIKSQTIESIFNRHSQIKGYPTASSEIEAPERESSDTSDDEQRVSSPTSFTENERFLRNKFLDFIIQWAQKYKEQSYPISMSLRAQRKTWEFYFETVNAMEDNKNIIRMGFGFLTHRVIIAFLNAVLVNSMIDSGDFEDTRLIKPVTEDRVFLANIKRYKESEITLPLFDLLFSFPLWGAFLDKNQSSYQEWESSQASLSGNDFKFNMTIPRFNKEIELENLFELFNSIPVINIE